MSEERYHLEIPKENIRNIKYEKTGGGTTYQRVNHRDHGLKLIASTKELLAATANKKDPNTTSEIFLQIETPKDVSIKNEKYKIEQLGLNIINFSKENKSIGIASIQKEAINSFQEKLIEYTETEDNIGKTYFAVIEDVKPVPPETKIKAELNFESEDPISIVINLYNILARVEKLAIYGAISEEIRKHTDNFSVKNFANGITSIACTIPSNVVPQIASDFDTIKEIKPNYITYIGSSIPAETIKSPLEIKPPISTSAVCIIDSGIQMGNGIFDTLVINQVRELPYGSIDCHYNHGSFVASRCIFGDNIDSCLATNTLQPYCKVLDVAVFGKDALGRIVNPDEYLLRIAIEDVVLANYKNIKVYNLSLGSEDTIKDFEVSEIAKLIDYLSKKYKVLFIVASGNMNSLAGLFPNEHFAANHSRIGMPAESLLSLTVGSIAKHTNPDALSVSNELSPFSRIGPGADLGVKPELVAHGGNLISPYTPLPRVSTYGIYPDGKTLAVDNGTSFAAPLIAQYAQRLFDLYPNSDPNLVKALLCHFAQKRSIHDEILDSELMYTGFGEPIIENAINASAHNAVYIYTKAN